MDGPVGVTRPSLDRLKALDQLPDLPSQLEEARSLCDHSARADMICKWLLSKLRSDQESRSSSDVWRTLYSAFRLLSPERLATLLASHDCLGSCQSALEEAEDAKVLLATFGDLFSFLLECSEGVHGSHIKAVLSVPASKAASFLGVWLQAVHDNKQSLGTELLNDFSQSMLRPGIEVWNLRKHSVEENALFAEHCLLPAISMRKKLSIDRSLPTTKRKRRSNGSSQQNCEYVLESLLAKHVFLHARRAFIKTQNPSEVKAREQVDSLDPSSAINAMLAPLKMKIAQNGDDGPSYSNELSLLLDTALRCVPILTPKQRAKEKPWIEAVIQALQDCSGSSAGETTDRLCLNQMLSVLIDRNAPTSKDTLERVVRNHTNLGHQTKRQVDWSLVGTVVKLDSDVFVNVQVTQTLFSDITQDTFRLAEPYKNQPLNADDLVSNQISPASPFRVLVSDEIVIPIMNAFAKRRDLATFVDLWTAQLQRDEHNERWSVWAELEDAFGSILEDSLNEERVTDLFDRFSTIITDAANASSGGEISQAKLDASIVILNAILGGVRSEELMKKLQGRMSSILESMLQLLAEPSGSTGSSRLTASTGPQSWTLITKAFEMWFPAWAVQQSNLDVIADKGLSMLSSDAIRTVLSLAKPIRSRHGTSMVSRRVACEAETFVASLCFHFDEYKQSSTEELQATCKKTADDLMQQLDVEDLQAIVRYPNVAAAIDPEIRIAFLKRCFDAASGSGEFSKASSSAGQALLAVLGTAVEAGKVDVVQDLVDIALHRIEQYEETKKPSGLREDLTAIRMLSAIPAGMVSRISREAVLDAVLRAQISDQAVENFELQAARLALLVKVMEVPNASSTICTDPAGLWELASSINLGSNTMLRGTSTIEGLRALSYLEELAKLTLMHLLATQDQERSTAVLVGLSAKGKEYIDTICHQHLLDGHGAALAVAAVLIDQLENGSRADLKSQLPHRDSQTMTRLVKSLYESVTTQFPNICGNPADVVSAGCVLPALKTLLAIPESLMQSTNADAAALQGYLEEASLVFLTTSRTKDNEKDFTDNMEALLPIFTSFYEIVCKHLMDTPNSSFEYITQAIAKLRLPPEQHHAFLAAFARPLEKLDSQLKIALLEKLLTGHGEEPLPSPTALSMARLCISRLDKDAVAGIHRPLAQSLLPRLFSIITQSSSLTLSQRALDCVATILREKSFLITQHNVESILSNMLRLLKNGKVVSIIYLNICQIVSILLLQYRSRLHGRFHVVIVIFQELISRLFRSTRSRPNNGLAGRDLTDKHARAVARMLTLFCTPPQLRRQAKRSTLINESRKEQAHVGQFAQYILHHYCAQTLAGTLVEGMREALTPGLWSAIEAIEINDSEGIKSLSAAMNNSERAVLRGVYEDWRRFGKWRGG